MTTPFTEGYTGSDVKWRPDFEPPYPHFQDCSAIASIVLTVKRELHRHLIAAVEYALSTENLTTEFPLPLSDAHRHAWIAGLITKRYGRVYFLNRYEAAALLRRFSNDGASLAAVDELLRDGQRVNRIYNFAVLSYLQSLGAVVDLAPISIPTFCVHSCTAGRVCVNETDFVGRSPDQLFADPIPLYDLHDFSHRCCTLLSAELYGAKYFEHSFLALPAALKRLIRDREFATSGALEHSDSLAFRELSLGMFDALPSEDMLDADVVNAIGDGLVGYYAASRAMYHPATGTMMKAAAPLAIDQLAVLAQNKAYEHIASEFEEQIMTRGGDVASLDPFHGLDAIGVASAVVSSSRPFYYHRRNYLRHRSHTEAITRFCRDYLKPASTGVDAAFADVILRNLSFEDYRSGARRNLFAEVCDRHAGAASAKKSGAVVSDDRADL